MRKKKVICYGIREGNYNTTSIIGAFASPEDAKDCGCGVTSTNLDKVKKSMASKLEYQIRQWRKNNLKSSELDSHINRIRLLKKKIKSLTPEEIIAGRCSQLVLIDIAEQIFLWEGVSYHKTSLKKEYKQVELFNMLCQCTAIQSELAA